MVRQKMGHQHKHQRDQAIVSPSKYTEFSFLWLSRERERERGNDITIPWRGRFFLLLVSQGSNALLLSVGKLQIEDASQTLTDM